MIEGAWTIDACGSETVYGSGWAVTWEALLRAREMPLTKHDGLGLMAAQDVIKVSHIDRDLEIKKQPVGMAGRLALSVLEQLEGSTRRLLYIASNHGESDLIVALARALSERKATDSNLIRELLQLNTQDALATALRAFETCGASVQSACSSGLVALVLGAMRGRREGCGVTVVASDALSDIECIGFSVARATSSTRCCPFAEGSDGLTIGEGAAGVNISWHKAESLLNGNPVILGFGLSCDAFHSTSPEESGEMLERAWRSAIRMSGLEPQDIAAVVLHGTGTPANDSVETKVYRRIWSDSEPPVCSIKNFVGHTMGASGLLNLLVARSFLETGLLPPTLKELVGSKPVLPIGIGEPICVTTPSACLVVGSGFGGQNVAIVVGLWQK